MKLTLQVTLDDLSDGTDPQLVRGAVELALRQMLWDGDANDTATVVVAQPTDQQVVVTGNPVDGLSFYGPFPTHTDALEAIEQAVWAPDYWWIAALSTPDDLTDPNADGE